MRDETIQTFLVSASAILVAMIVIAFYIKAFAETETEIITLDSGKQCVATVKFNDVTNLDCEG